MIKITTYPANPNITGILDKEYIDPLIQETFIHLPVLPNKKRKKKCCKKYQRKGRFCKSCPKKYKK